MKTQLKREKSKSRYLKIKQENNIFTGHLWINQNPWKNIKYSTCQSIYISFLSSYFRQMPGSGEHPIQNQSTQLHFCFLYGPLHHYNNRAAFYLIHTRLKPSLVNSKHNLEITNSDIIKEKEKNILFLFNYKQNRI